LVGCLFFAASNLYLLAELRSHGAKLDTLEQKFQEVKDNATQIQGKTDAELEQLVHNMHNETQKQLALISALETEIGIAMTNMTAGVMLWPFNLTDLPAGWALCDGTRGTPDLRGRAVAGVGHFAGAGGSGDIPLGDYAEGGLVRAGPPTVPGRRLRRFQTSETD
jgi:hypothetical protein